MPIGNLWRCGTVGRVQEEEGAEKVGGRVFTTATGAMCLEVYYRYLPMYRDQDKNQLMITHGNGGRVPYDADMKRFSPMPPKSWTQTRFDDACWARYTPDDLADFLGDCAAAAELAGVKTQAKWDQPPE